MHNVAPHARHLCRTPYRAQERLRRRVRAGIDALESMLAVYGYGFPVLRFETGLTDSVIGYRLSPGRMRRLLL